MHDGVGMGLGGRGRGREKGWTREMGARGRGGRRGARGRKVKRVCACNTGRGRGGWGGMGGLRARVAGFGPGVGRGVQKGVGRYGKEKPTGKKMLFKRRWKEWRLARCRGEGIMESGRGKKKGAGGCFP